MTVKSMDRKVRPVSRTMRGWLSFLLLALTCNLLVVRPAALAQIPFASSEDSSPAAKTKPWWDLAQAERCGRLWCSRVLIPYIGTAKDNTKIMDDFQQMAPNIPIYQKISTPPLELVDIASDILGA